LGRRNKVLLVFVMEEQSFTGLWMEEQSFTGLGDGGTKFYWSLGRRKLFHTENLTLHGGHNCF
jgi:hypothetical protein